MAPNNLRRRKDHNAFARLFQRQVYLDFQSGFLTELAKIIIGKASTIISSYWADFEELPVFFRSNHLHGSFMDLLQTLPACLLSSESFNFSSSAIKSHFTQWSVLIMSTTSRRLFIVAAVGLVAWLAGWQTRHSQQAKNELYTLSIGKTKTFHRSPRLLVSTFSFGVYSYSTWSRF